MREIYLDVDDTLNSLTLHILNHYGCPISAFDYGHFPTHVGYDIMRAAVELGGDAPTDVAEFWIGVTEADLWRSAPKSPQCDTIIDMAATAVGRENVYIATSPTKDALSHSDKVEWIQDNLPEWLHRQYFITPRKWQLGQPGALLVDDHKENCDKFIQRGGDALLVPRPWNPDFHKDTDWALTQRLESLYLENTPQ
jgi:5'(3')-deoxyribonucleotidase